MAKIFLVRHGFTGLDEYEQKPGDGLSEIGTKQAKQVAKRVKSAEPIIHKIYTSNMERALETASIIAVGCKSRIKIDNRLNEIDLITNPDMLEALRKHKTQYGKELHLLRYAQKKAVSLLRDLAEKHHNDTIIIVTHGNMIRGIIAAALDAKIDTVAHLQVHNASLSILEYDPPAKYFTLTLFNDTSHLD